MGHNPKQLSSPFVLEGRYLGFVPNQKGKFKCIHLATAQGHYRIKIPKFMRGSLLRTLTPEEWVRISGFQFMEGEAEDIKWEADQVEIIPDPPLLTAKVQDASPPPPTPSGSGKPASTCILICDKSSCRKRGGAQIKQALAAHLSTHPQGDHISIRTAGCMKSCKTGPNLVVMPAHARYSQVSPLEIPSLIQKHFPIPSEQSLDHHFTPCKTV